MTSKARAEYDYMMDGVRIAVRRNDGREYVRWGEQTVEPVNEAPIEAPHDAWLRLREDDARAIYEALADHFGHSGHDTRALRRDYDAERSRVDKFIAHLTDGRQ